MNVRLLTTRSGSGRMALVTLFAWLGMTTMALFAAGQVSGPTAILESPFLRLTISSASGHCEVEDKQTGVVWGSMEPDAGLGTATMRAGGQSQSPKLTSCQLKQNAGRSELTAIFQPLSNNSAELRVRFKILPDQRTIDVQYEADAALQLESISPLTHLLTVSGSAHGYAIVPVREGLLIPADSGLAFTQRFDTYAYEGCHMEMLGVVQNGSAALASWDDPYVAADLRSTGIQTNSGSKYQRIYCSLNLSKSAKGFRLQFLGHGDYVDIARAYREIAREKGFLVTWKEKLKTNPERAKLFGAANIKLWSTLDRRMNEDSTKEETVRTNWTFEEAAQVAEHLKQDLRLDRVLFTIGGWIHRGYDNQHPDILPTAPECGGDTAFADCARRVMNQGYLFCLHDNYQDIYRDSPSWDEKWVMKTPDGKLARGGHWAGGLAFITCSKMALELAQRPQNLTGVKKLSNANAYFIDTTYAAGLQECFDPNHPLTRADDLRWKQALSDYARGVFGVFGSECGREWAIPHSDFFEGLTGVSGGAYHNAKLLSKVGGTVIPLFDLVYRDCIAMYGKYGYDPGQAAHYVLQHLVFGRPLNYHSIPAHLYWKIPKPPATQSVELSPLVAKLEAVGPRRFTISYRWTVQTTPKNPWQVFVHFTDSDGNIKFQGDYRPDPPVSAWKPGEVQQGPFMVSVPEGLNGTFEIRMGLFQPGTGERAVLSGLTTHERACVVGKLVVDRDRIELQPIKAIASEGDGLDLFTRADNGWAAGLDETDRFIKNTYEVLSPLNEITAQMQMTRHEFLSADRQIQRTTFGQGVEQVVVTVNFGDADYQLDSKAGGSLRLPRFGFLVESAEFVAFYARNWNGREFTTPSLFTLRSQDHRPIRASQKVRVFHVFGDDKLRLKIDPVSIVKEAQLTPD
jgi:hypothetical protein